MEILKLSRGNQAIMIKIVAHCIKAGKTVVFPTDTVYGILCDATNKKSVDRIFKIKQRNPKKIFPVFVKNIKTAKKLAKINKEQENFLKKSWPGKITVVLPRKPPKTNYGRTKEYSKIYGIDPKTIGLRIPRHKLINLLLKKINIPLVQTSANISGEKTPQNAKKIIKELSNKKFQPDLVIDAGKLKQSKQSKMIDLTVSPPKILR